MKREAGYVAFGLILAVLVTFTYFHVAPQIGPPVAYQILKETTARADVGAAANATFTPMLPLTVLGVALLCACLTYSITKKRSSRS